MKEIIKQKLLNTKREGMEELVKWMENNKYFESPASAKYHLACEKGLIMHCQSLEQLFRKMINDFNLEVSEDTIIIASYLHDICKAGAYIKSGDIYSWNKAHPKGHCKLSIDIISRFITLTEEEKILISYHMGMYNTNEFSSWAGEYSIKELVDSYNTIKLAKLFYFCDDMSTNFLEK